MTHSKKPYPRFISNAPCGEDLFEGQSQKAIADCISELLLNDDSCKIVGIDGQWGGGKSNLVEIVRKTISDRYFTFVYDAWGHQEDLQRRAILEELTESLILSEKLPSNNWNEKLKQLLAKTREVETKSIPGLGMGIILAGLVLILTPLFSVIADVVPEEHIWWRVGITVVPFIFLLAYFLIRWARGKEKSPKKVLMSLFYLYQGRQSEETSYETISEDEPSVKKFRNWMSEISEALGERKLLLVFDNMDRLPSEKVQELWSSIHTFFAEKSYPNIRVIVPFDRAHIKTAFKTNGEEECFGNDFINKTFNVVFRVSPPILSDWKNYFKLKWDEALGDIDAEEYGKVLQIFDALCPNITPREIVAFINEYVSIKLASHNYVIPGRYIALFLLAKEEILLKQKDEILDPSYLGRLNVLYEKDESLPKYIASLVYQIDPEKALQIAYTRSLSTALDSGYSDTVLAISKIREFTSILGNVISSLNNYENVVLALAKVPQESFTTPYQYQDIWDTINAKLHDIQNEGQIIKPYQKILIEKVSDKKSLIEKILNEFYNSKKFTSTDFFASVNKMEETAGDMLGMSVFSLLADKQTSAEDFIGLVGMAGRAYPKYRVTCPVEKIDEHLAGLNLDQLKDISFLPNYDDDKKEELTKYVNSLRTKRTSAEANVDTLEILLARQKEVERPVSQLISDAWIFNHCVKLKDNTSSYSGLYYDLIAMRLARGNIFAATHAQQFVNVLNSNSNNLAESVAVRIEYYINFGNYLLGLEKFYQYPLCVNVAKKLIDGGYGVSRAQISHLIFKFDNIVNWIGVEEIKLLARLNQWEVPVDGIIIENVCQIPILFFEISWPNTEKYRLAKHCVDTAIAYMDSLSEQAWASAFKETNSYIFRLSDVLNYQFSLSAQKAFDATLRGIALGEFPIANKSLYAKRIDAIITSGGSLMGVFNAIIDIFIKQENITPQLFSFFGEWLFRYAQLNKKGALKTLFPPGVLGNNACLNLIIDYKEKVPAILAKAIKEDKEIFIDKILSLKSSHRNKKFKSFLEYLKIDKKKRIRKKK